MFEVEHLRYATLATVSRCGMIWFSDDVIDTAMICRHNLDRLASAPVGSEDEDSLEYVSGDNAGNPLDVQKHIVTLLEPHFAENGLVRFALDAVQRVDHIMDFTVIRALNTLFSLCRATIRSVLDYNLKHSDFPLASDKVEAYISRKLLLNVVWSFCGDSRLALRAELGEKLRLETGI